VTVGLIRAVTDVTVGFIFTGPWVETPRLPSNAATRLKTRLIRHLSSRENSHRRRREQFSSRFDEQYR